MHNLIKKRLSFDFDPFDEVILSERKERETMMKKQAIQVSLEENGFGYQLSVMACGAKKEAFLCQVEGNQLRVVVVREMNPPPSSFRNHNIRNRFRQRAMSPLNGTFERRVDLPMNVKHESMKAFLQDDQLRVYMEKEGDDSISCSSPPPPFLLKIDNICA